MRCHMSHTILVPTSSAARLLRPRMTHGKPACALATGAPQLQQMSWQSISNGLAWLPQCTKGRTTRADASLGSAQQCKGHMGAHLWSDAAAPCTCASSQLEPWRCCLGTTQDDAAVSVCRNDGARLMIVLGAVAAAAGCASCKEAPGLWNCTAPLLVGTQS